MTQFSHTLTQWEIYDHYMADWANQQMQKKMVEQADKGKKTGGYDSYEEPASAKATARNKEEDTVHSQKMENALKILERLVNQNAEDEIFQDFKFWEDASDQFREGEGSLLPLWRFSTDRTKRKQVRHKI